MPQTHGVTRGVVRDEVEVIEVIEVEEEGAALTRGPSSPLMDPEPNARAVVGAQRPSQTTLALRRLRPVIAQPTGAS